MTGHGRRIRSFRPWQHRRQSPGIYLSCRRKRARPGSTSMMRSTVWPPTARLTWTLPPGIPTSARAASLAQGQATAGPRGSTGSARQPPRRRRVCRVAIARTCSSACGWCAKPRPSPIAAFSPPPRACPGRAADRGPRRRRASARRRRTAGCRTLAGIGDKPRAWKPRAARAPRRS